MTKRPVGACRTNDSESIRLAAMRERVHETRQPGDMIGVKVREQNSLKALETPAITTHGNLSTFPAVDKVESGIYAKERRGKIPLRQRHHCSGTQQQDIEHSHLLAHDTHQIVLSAQLPRAGDDADPIDVEEASVPKTTLVTVDVMIAERQ